MNTSFNRTILLVCFLALVGFLATLNLAAKDLVMIIGAVATPITLYLGIKGKGSTPGNTGSDS